MIRVTDRIALDEAELVEVFVRASGPGGQNVNKVATAVQLRFDAGRSPNLPEFVRAKLMELAGQRLTNEGVIVISAQRFRTQERNRADAIEKLCDLIRQASHVPKYRRPTRPTLASKTRRLKAKDQRSTVKALRGSVRGDD